MCGQEPCLVQFLSGQVSRFFFAKMTADGPKSLQKDLTGHYEASMSFLSLCFSNVSFLLDLISSRGQLWLVLHFSGAHLQILTRWSLIVVSQRPVCRVSRSLLCTPPFSVTQPWSRHFSCWLRAGSCIFRRRRLPFQVSYRLQSSSAAVFRSPFGCKDSWSFQGRVVVARVLLRGFSCCVCKFWAKISTLLVSISGFLAFWGQWILFCALSARFISLARVWGPCTFL